MISPTLNPKVSSRLESIKRAIEINFDLNFLSGVTQRFRPILICLFSTDRFSITSDSSQNFRFVFHPRNLLRPLEPIELSKNPQTSVATCSLVIGDHK